MTLVQSASNALQIAVNGTVDQTTRNVVLLQISGGKIVQENAAGNWYSEPASGGTWTQIASPLPVTPPIMPPTVPPATPPVTPPIIPPFAPPFPVLPVITGSGSDSLVLGIAEDAYEGDAQFTVSVDGKQLGGTFTTTASHAAGISQSFIFLGDWASGAHTVAVNYLNDAYGGSSAADRNLYVDSLSYDGAATGQSRILLGNGPRSFSVTDNSAIPVAPARSPCRSPPAAGPTRWSSPCRRTPTRATHSSPYRSTASSSAAPSPPRRCTAAGASQSFTFKGDFGSGQHAVVVNYPQ